MKKETIKVRIARLIVAKIAPEYKMIKKGKSKPKGKRTAYTVTEIRPTD